jgi:hypothetical protein
MGRRAETGGVAGMEAWGAPGNSQPEVRDECGADVPLEAQP